MPTMPYCKKVIVIGASGLIGKEVIKPLQKLGFEVFTLTRKNYENDNSIIQIHGDIFDEPFIKHILEEIKATHLLNFAWTTTEDYLHSNLNFEYVKASLNLLKYFKENDGKKAIFAGTCFEYAFQNTALTENSLLSPQSIYAKCKNSLLELGQAYCMQNDIDFGWGRIFYVYGHGEHEKRLTAHIINSLNANKDVIIHNGDLIKDYMYTKDVAQAFAQFLYSDICGCVNICTGQEISLRDYAGTIAKIMKKENFLHINQEDTTQPLYIVGDNTKLTQEIGYKIKYTLHNAISEIIRG